MGSALYLDMATGKIKTARHITFDEDMSDSNNPLPYVQESRVETRPGGLGRAIDEIPKE